MQYGGDYMKAIFIIIFSAFAIIGIINVVVGIINTVNGKQICNKCTLIVDISNDDVIDSNMYALELILQDKNLSNMQIIVNCTATEENYDICKKYCEIHNIKMLKTNIDI